jgi:hypothetical protein
MSCPGTPLDASWLASRVIPYLKDPVLDVCTEDLVHRREVVTYRQRVVERLSQLKLPVLQDHPEIMEWLQQNPDVKRPSLLDVHLSWVYAPMRARRAAALYNAAALDAAALLPVRWIASPAVIRVGVSVGGAVVTCTSGEN